ncbi:hypothetical protein [Wenzhouxiangella sp. XN24]|uniref:hypothetical protein n=1 Tax=Wenzhouxiangella sp. XN24 TaxID=2713569 RepID=UPI0013EA35BD|nr:hypothetical protein [Wenzhouxiangella sp. XN24]NGX16967.1 hypothetical protein [Wenzhouxiangella sp. XN24]
MKAMTSNPGSRRVLPALTLAAICGVFLFGGPVAAADDDLPRDPPPDPPRETAAERPDRPELSLTMRIIEDPDALGAGAVTRRLSLPPPRLREVDSRPPDGRSDQAGGEAPGRGSGRPLREQAAERARDMAEQARERREDFGRSRAEELRPERPDPPNRPRPPGRP